MADEINTEIVEALFKIARNFKGKIHEDTENSHLTMLQCQALECIKKKKDVHMQDIAKHFSTSMPTATSLIDKLITAKLVKRENDSKDRRIVKIFLTKLGDKFLQYAVKRKSEKMNKLLSYLPAKDKKELLRILKTLAEKSENL
jgi:MarR family transcriptional regulator, organic hydroperoxide resistance regulator